MNRLIYLLRILCLMFKPYSINWLKQLLLKLEEFVLWSLFEMVKDSPCPDIIKYSHYLLIVKFNRLFWGAQNVETKYWTIFFLDERWLLCQSSPKEFGHYSLPAYVVWASKEVRSVEAALSEGLLEGVCLLQVRRLLKKKAWY